MNIFSVRLSEAMLHNNRMTQVELAELTGTTSTTISRYIKGDRKPNTDMLIKISKVLNVSPNYLLGFDEDMNGKVVGTIDVKKALDYCERTADGWKDFQMKAMDNIGHGDSIGASFGSVSFGYNQETMFRYEIPRVLKYLSNS